MGKLLNFLMTNNWEQYKKVNLYDNLIKFLSKEDFEKVKEVIEKQ